MKKILIILGHPDSASFCAGIADSYEQGAKSAKHKIKRLNLGDIKFDPILHHGYNKIQELEPDLKQAQKDIKWAKHIVIITPIWWGLYPAILKGFIDRVFLPGFSFKYTGKFTWDKLLPNRSGRIITTSGGPALYYKYIVHAPALKALKSTTLNFCGISPVKTTMFGSIRKTTNPKRIEKILAKVKTLGAKGI
ncbi:flavodoxin family protein [Candidatus Uhrbacteria bacterium]|nr:flavodoxin family protein [Candidatus Uhrbacteria bacterium]